MHSDVSSFLPPYSVPFKVSPKIKANDYLMISKNIQSFIMNKIWHELHEYYMNKILLTKAKMHLSYDQTTVVTISIK